MKDTLETNLPEEAGKLEETKKPVETPEIDATADVEANDTAEADAAIAAGKLTKEEILAKLTELVETSVETSRGEVEALKQAYYILPDSTDFVRNVKSYWINPVLCRINQPILQKIKKKNEIRKSQKKQLTFKNNYANLISVTITIIDI